MELRRRNFFKSLLAGIAGTTVPATMALELSKPTPNLPAIPDTPESFQRLMLLASRASQKVDAMQSELDELRAEKAVWAKLSQWEEDYRIGHVYSNSASGEQLVTESIDATNEPRQQKPWCLDTTLA